MTDCWLARNGVMEDGDPMPPCSGRLRACHLIPKQLLKREGADPNDPRAIVYACGGPDYGNAGHHGMLDHSRRLRIPREAIPEQVEELAREIGLVWWLTREYGEW